MQAISHTGSGCLAGSTSLEKPSPTESISMSHLAALSSMTPAAAVSVHQTDHDHDGPACAPNR